MKKVIELIRVSTLEQAGADHASIPSQKVTNKRTADAYGLKIIKSFEITDVSGTAVLRSPEMQELLRMITSPEIDGVVVREFSRVMRPDNFGDYVLFQAFQDTRTLLYLPDGPLDLNSKTGKLMAGLRAMIAGNELSEIRERVWSAKEEKRRAGQHTQSSICLPFGVGYSKEQGFFYKPEAERVREAFRRLLSGETSYIELAKLLGFTGQGMRIILTNPIYMGWRVYENKRDMSSTGKRYSAGGRQGDRKKIRRDAEEVIRVKVIDPPLVPEDQFHRAQETVAAKLRLHWRHRAGITPKFTYNGFLVCSDCEHSLYGYHSRNLYYVCSHRVGKVKTCRAPWMRRDELEQKLDFMFGEKFTSKEFISDVVGQFAVKTDAAAIRSRMAGLELQIKKLREKRQRILDVFLEGLLSHAERDQRLTDVDTQMRATEEALLREVPAPVVTAKSLAKAFAPLFDWQYLNRESKRRILTVTVPEIHVSNYSVRGVSVATPSFCSDFESRTRAGFVLAANSDRIFIPLSL